MAAVGWRKKKKENSTRKQHITSLLLVSITASHGHDCQQGSTAKPRRSEGKKKKKSSDSSTNADGKEDGARESHQEPIVQLPAPTYTRLNQLRGVFFFIFFILDAFITLDRSPELPSKLLILSHKVYCHCITLHFRLR